MKVCAVTIQTDPWKKRGPMNFKLKFVAAAMLAASLVASSAYAGQATPPAKKKHNAKTTKTTTTVTKVYTAPAPTAAHVEAQIQALREEMQSQINNLKSDLAAKDDQLMQAQAAAAAKPPGVMLIPL